MSVDYYMELGIVWSVILKILYNSGKQMTIKTSKEGLKVDIDGSCFILPFGLVTLECLDDIMRWCV